MKTTSYNPSPLEVEFANILTDLKKTISDKLSKRKIDSMENHIDMDNPTLRINISDDDGDKHVLVLKLIQKPDESI